MGLCTSAIVAWRPRFCCGGVLKNEVGLGGHWSVEAGFGPCALGTPAAVLESTEVVRAWVTGRFRGEQSCLSFVSVSWPTQPIPCTIDT